MKMIRGGNNAEQQIPKMSVAVDSRNNMLIVRAPDPLFEEVKAFVEEQDQAGDDSPQTTKVVSLRHTNSSAVQKALTSILGNVKTNTTTAQSTESPRTDNNRGGDDDDSPEERMRRSMRRNWEMMQEMRRATDAAAAAGAATSVAGSSIAAVVDPVAAAISAGGAAMVAATAGVAEIAAVVAIEVAS